MTPEASTKPPALTPRPFGFGGRRLALLRTTRRLGLRAALDVALYRLSLKTGTMRRKTPGGPALSAPRFPSRGLEPTGRPASAEALAAREGRLAYFGWKELEIGSPPDWHLNPMTGGRAGAGHWSTIPDFSDTVGDVKLIWEASRFHWAPLFARTALETGDGAWIELLNDWIADWCAKNPANCGPNWKCGQETGLRLLGVLEAARLLDREPENAVDFVAAHCARIAPTMRYAIAQRNNHATSEAVALFVGGAWLEGKHQSAREWRDLGRVWIDRAVDALIEEDGGFAQNSMNYHRLMIDTLSTAEVWRRRCDLSPFAETTQTKLADAADWLRTMTDPDTGLAPNLGNNDGAWFHRVNGRDYEDFRPSAELATSLFATMPREGQTDQSESPSGLTRGFGAESTAPGNDISRLFLDSGYAVLRSGRTRAIMRAPNARFRPPQADALHVDLWRDGRPVICDGGTYSYNGAPEWTGYFASAAAHDAPVFDGQDAMPRLGRFLYADWIDVKGDDTDVELEDGRQAWGAEYGTRDGRRCRRNITVSPDTAEIADFVEGHDESVAWRFRLAPGEWRMEQGACIGEGVRIEIEGATPDLVREWESRRYFEITETQALTFTLGPGPRHVTTRISFTGEP